MSPASGGFAPQTPTGALPLDPAGGLPSPDPLFCPPLANFWLLPWGGGLSPVISGGSCLQGVILGYHIVDRRMVVVEEGNVLRRVKMEEKLSRWNISGE